MIDLIQHNVSTADNSTYDNSQGFPNQCSSKSFHGVHYFATVMLLINLILIFCIIKITSHKMRNCVHSIIERLVYFMLICTRRNQPTIDRNLSGYQDDKCVKSEPKLHDSIYGSLEEVNLNEDYELIQIYDSIHYNSYQYTNPHEHNITCDEKRYELFSKMSKIVKSNCFAAVGEKSRNSTKSNLSRCSSSDGPKNPKSPNENCTPDFTRTFILEM